MINCNQQTIKKLKVLSKALPKQSPRNYGTSINIKNGKACMTDGFHLMYCTGIEAMDEMTVNADFFPSEIKYPRWEAILPANEKRRELPAMEIFNLIKCLGAMANLRDIYMYIDRDMKVSLITGDKSNDWMNEYKGTIFNPAIVTRSIKALDKNTLPENAFMTLDDDGVTGRLMQLDFTGGFHIVMVAIEKKG